MTTFCLTLVDSVEAWVMMYKEEAIIASISQAQRRLSIHSMNHMLLEYLTHSFVVVVVELVERIGTID